MGCALALVPVEWQCWQPAGKPCGSGETLPAFQRCGQGGNRAVNRGVDALAELHALPMEVRANGNSLRFKGSDSGTQAATP
jgi:hypothetical protein